MRSEAMERLDVLTGTWRLTMRNAWFLEPAGVEVPGTAWGEWLEDAFVVVRWTLDQDVAPATRDNVLVLGRDDSRDAYTALYHDERGVGRTFAMSLDGPAWTLLREDPDMYQRFSAELGDGRITGRWEASDDHGASWRTDLELEFLKTPL